MKKFLNILPDLKLSHEMAELFETVECEKVAASRDHSRIKIYIHSDRLIAHKAIRETERAIRSQMFKDQVDVCLVEKYHLSRQYTPARLLEVYTGSLIDELEEEGFLYAVPAKGFFVAPKNTELLREENLKKIEAHLTEAVRLSASCGLSREELREMLELLWEG